MPVQPCAFTNRVLSDYPYRRSLNDPRGMTMPKLSEILLAGALAAGLTAAAAAAAAEPTPGPGEPTLDEVRRLTERFRDVKVAEAEGYVRDGFDLCDTADMMGRPA